MPTAFDTLDPIDPVMVYGAEAINTVAPPIVTQAGPLQDSVAYATKGSGGSRRDLAASLGTLGSIGAGGGGGGTGGGVLGGGLLDGGPLATAMALAAATPNTLGSLGFMGDSGGTVDVTGLLVNPGTLLLAPGPGYAALNLSGTIQGGTVMPQASMGLILNGGTLSSLTWTAPLALAHETVTLDTVVTGPISLLDSTLIEAGTVGALDTIALSGASDTLQFDHLGGVSATLTGWRAGDRIVLPAGSGYALGWNAGTLDVLQNGSQMAAFAMGSGFDLADFQLDTTGGRATIDTAVVTWTNAFGGDWATGADWSTAPAIPDPTDAATIGLPGTYTVTVTGTQTVGTLLLNDPNATLAVYGTFSASYLMLNAGTLALQQNATLSNSTVTDFSGTDVQSGTLVHDAWQGVLNAYNLTIAGGLTVTQTDGTTPGVLNATQQSSQLNFADSETIDNMIVNLGSANATYATLNAYDQTLTLGQHATLNVGGYQDLVGYGVLINLGQLNILSGYQRFGVFSGPPGINFINLGTIAIASGADLVLFGDVSTSGLGTIQRAPGGQLELDGTLDNSGNTLALTQGSVLNGATMSALLTGGTVLSEGGAFAFQSGNPVATFSNLVWRGTLALSTTYLMLQPNVVFQSLDGSGPGSIVLSNSQLSVTNGGTLDGTTVIMAGGNDVVAAGSAYFPQGPLTFGTGATLNATAGGGTVSLAGTTLTNDGTIIVAGANETVSAPDATVVNNGSIQVSGGATLTVGVTPYVTSAPVVPPAGQGESFINNGQIAIGPNGSVRIGPYETSFTNSGTIAFSGATGTLEVDGTIGSLGVVTGSGGKLVVGGLYDNSGKTLNIGAGSSFGTLAIGASSLASRSGEILGGTIAAATGSILFDSGILDGVTWQGPITIGGSGNNLVRIRNGLNIQQSGGGPAVITLTSPWLATVEYLDNETLNDLTILATGASSAITDNSDLTFGATTTLVVTAGSQQSVALGSAWYSGLGTFTNAGSILDTLSANSTISVSGSLFVNTGVIEIAGTGNMLEVESGNFVNTGLVNIANGATLYLDAPIQNGIAVGTFSNSGTLAIDRSSTLALGGTVTAATFAEVQTDGSATELLGTLLNTGSLFAPAAGSPLANLQIGGIAVGTILGGTVVDNGGLSLLRAVLDGVTWEGPVDLTTPNASLSVMNGSTLLSGSGGGPLVINVTGSGASISFDTGTLADAHVNLATAGGTGWFYGAAPAYFYIGPPSVLTLATDTTLDVLPNQSTLPPILASAVLSGNIDNLGLIDIRNGDLIIGRTSGPPVPDTGVIVSLAAPFGSFDNHGTIFAEGTTGSTVTVGDMTIFGNEGLFQVANGEDLIIQTSASTFTNTGTLAIYAGSTIEFAGIVGNVGTIAFATPDGTLRFDHLGTVAATVTQWQAGDRILLPAGTGYTLTFNAGTLDLLQNGSHVAAFAVGSAHVAGDFQIDTSGGLVAIDTPAGTSNQPETIAAGDTVVVNATVNLGGNGGMSSLAIVTGGTLIADAFDQSAGPLGTGDAVVSGLGSDLSVTGQMTVGDNGTAALTIIAGATATAGSVVIGVHAGSAGTVDVEGAGSLLHIAGPLTIGAGGSATLILGQGARVIADGGYTLGAGGTVIQNGGTLDPPGLSTNHGTMGGTGTTEGDIENDGTIIASGGTYAVNGAVTGQNGSLAIAGTATLRLDQAVGAGQTVAFDSAAGTLSIGDLADFHATIADFQAGDIIQATASAPGLYDTAAAALIFSSGASIRFAEPLDTPSIAALVAMGLAQPSPLPVATGITAVATTGLSGWADIGVTHTPVLLLPTG